MVSTQLNSLVEVNQATLGTFCTRTFGVSCVSFRTIWWGYFHTFHLVFHTMLVGVSTHKCLTHRCFQEVFTHFKLRENQKNILINIELMNIICQTYIVQYGVFVESRNKYLITSQAS